MKKEQIMKRKREIKVEEKMDKRSKIANMKSESHN